MKLVRGDLGAPGSIHFPDRIDYVIHAAAVASEQARRELAVRDVPDHGEPGASAG